MFFSQLLLFIRHVWQHHRQLLAGLLLGFVLPWFVFVRVAREVWEDQGLPGDKWMLEFLHTHGTHAQDALAVGLSRAGGPIGASLLAAGIGVGLLVARKRRALLFFALAVVGAQLLNLSAKYVLLRTRPSLWVSLAPETSYSFPSGHSMAAAALATTVGFLLWRTRWRWPAVAAGLLWAGGMGWARMYLGVHYPSDVLAGWVGSVGWVGGLHLLFSRYIRELGVVWHEWEDRQREPLETL
jgi:membrane-associated phospholipid phosphatase